MAINREDKTMDTNYSDIAIIALNQPGIDQDQEILKAKFGGDVDDYHPLQGCYNGLVEASYIVPLTGHGNSRDQVLAVAKEYSQESILWLDNQRGAHLYFTDGKKALYLGKWREVPEVQAKSRSAYTYDPSVDKYFVAF